jgi:hypothetical protein
MILNLQRLIIDKPCESLHKGVSGNKENKMFIPKSRVLEELQKIGYDKMFHVTFQKTDGTFRTMCASMPTPDKPQFELKDNMPVVDLDKGAWRSFNLSRVTNITSGAE